VRGAGRMEGRTRGAVHVSAGCQQLCSARLARGGAAHVQRRAPPRDVQLRAGRGQARAGAEALRVVAARVSLALLEVGAVHRRPVLAQRHQRGHVAAVRLRAVASAARESWGGSHPARAAKCSGVSPSASRARGLAPALSSRVTTAASPSAAAQCRGVQST